MVVVLRMLTTGLRVVLLLQWQAVWRLAAVAAAPPSTRRWWKARQRWWLLLRQALVVRQSLFRQVHAYHQLSTLFPAGQCHQHQWEELHQLYGLQLSLLLPGPGYHKLEHAHLTALVLGVADALIPPVGEDMTI
jgi:hypothetical protein